MLDVITRHLREPSRDRTVLMTLRNLRHFWLAIGVLAAASLVPASASAACTSMPTGSTCTAVCCCEVSGSAAPMQANAEPAPPDRQMSAPNGIACPGTPGCACRAEAPVAPEPKGQPEREKEAGSNDHAAVSRGPGDIGPRLAGAVATTINSPQKSPLYLRHSRLLI